MIMYKINEVAKLLNVSSELLRYYERMGLIKPKRNPGGYRYYDKEDINLLLGILRYKKMNFTLAETAKLLYENDYSQTWRAYEAAKHRSEYEIKKQQAILKNISFIVDEWKNIEANYMILKKEKSEKIVRISMIEDEHIIDKHFSHAQKQMIELLPVSFISPLIRKEDHRIEFGYAIRADDLQALEGIIYDEYEVFDYQECVTTIVKTIGKNRLSNESLTFLWKYIADNAMVLKGDIWGYTIGNYINEEGIDVRVHKLFFSLSS